MTKEKFEHDARAIEEHVAGMAKLAMGMLHDGVTALRELDRDRAKSVIGRRDELADHDEHIEQEILRFLTLQAPVARDLRRIGASLKIITYLNRVGRYGYDIARVADDWPAGQGHVQRMVSVPDMVAKVEAMLDMVLTAFRERRAPDMDRLLELEEDVDALRFTVWREALTYMAQDPKHIEPCAHYMMVARYLERCADNVCKMAEKIHYAATGQRRLLK